MSQVDPSVEKVCATCKRTLALGMFSWKKAGKTRQAKCKDCNKAYCKAHYAEHKGEYLDRSKAQHRADREAQRAVVRELKAKPCADCGVAYPWYVMQFDHRDPSTKRTSIADAKNMVSGLPAFRKELDKCDVVCANCHRVRTHERTGCYARADPAIVPASVPKPRLYRRKSNGQSRDRTGDTRIFRTDGESP